MTHQEFEELAALDPLGETTQADKTALAGHLAGCPDCSAAALEFNEAAAAIALSLDPVAPPPEAWDGIRAAVLPRAATPLGRPERRTWWLAAAASLALALWGWDEYRIRGMRSEIEGLQASRTATEQQARRAAEQNETLSAIVAALTASQTRTFSLAGQQVAPSASAKVFLDPPRRRALVFFHDLPRNPADKSYQLWIIRADQTSPQPAGVFDVNEAGQAHLSVENLPVEVPIQALAVTLEPRGGVPAPTGAMYLVGKT